MKKLLSVALLLATTSAQAQTSPPPGTLSAAEILKHQHRHDSIVVAQAKRRKEIQVYNATYNRAHPLKKTATKSAKK